MDLFTRKSECGLSYKDAVFCYGMSKMTLANENEDSQKYLKMIFVEFLEMICRVADVKYKSSN